MKVAVTGATGFLGSHLVVRLRSAGHEIRALSGRSEPLADALEGCDAVVHLAGEPIAQRWTEEAKSRIKSSRVDGTRNLIRELSGAVPRPKTFLCASAIGVYGSRGDEVLTEASKPGEGFLAEVCKEWEQAAEAGRALGMRVVKLRTGVVLGRNGGALKQMLTPFRLGVGGRLGSGKQWMSWIHLDDIVGLMIFAIENPAVHGAINGTASNPVTNAEFTRKLAAALHRPAILPVPEFALKLLFGEMASIVVASQRVMPKMAERTGFPFRFPDLESALHDLLSVP